MGSTSMQDFSFEGREMAVPWRRGIRVGVLLLGGERQLRTHVSAEFPFGAPV
jgi:hypothetical protein